LVAAMIDAGATAEIDREWAEMFPQQVMVRIAAPGGADISVDFDGKSCQPDVHVATWNTRDAVFLNPSTLGDVNPHHYGKLNRVGYGLDHLIALLSADVAKFVDGRGYLAHDDPRIVAMADSYAAKGWSDPRAPRNPWVKGLAA
jgi:hypothetical protein